jgi:diadenosine tetraphosphatase ApaH/serine/threonine PP2A family protein phosphatase
VRIALITDVHANREALETVLGDIARVGVDRIVCLGDVVGYGADPVAAVELVARIVEDGGLCIKGNHDEAALIGPRGMSEGARIATEWTQRHIGDAERAFLGALPLAVQDGDMLFVHASAARPERWTYIVSADEAAESLAASDARLTFCGHTHQPALFSMLHGIAGTTGKTTTFRPMADKPVPLSPIRRHLAVIGSVGQPRDGDPRACWALLDTDTRELTYRRIPYDVEEAGRKIREAGLPEQLWVRLLVGR